MMGTKQPALEQGGNVVNTWQWRIFGGILGLMPLKILSIKNGNSARH